VNKSLKKKNTINMKTHHPLKQIKERRFLKVDPHFSSVLLGKSDGDGGVFATYKEES
jgi:hypothetical protein